MVIDFRQKSDGSYVKRKNSKCECILHPCPKCREMNPIDLLDCCKGYCQNCAIEIFDVFGYVKKKLSIQELADLMAEFYNYKYVDVTT